jgi:hypothetical protein
MRVTLSEKSDPWHSCARCTEPTCRVGRVGPPHQTCAVRYNDECRRTVGCGEGKRRSVETPRAGSSLRFVFLCLNAAGDPACDAALKAYRFQVTPRTSLQRAMEVGHAYPNTGDQVERTVLQFFLFSLARNSGFERMWASVNRCARCLLSLPWFRYFDSSHAHLES